MGVLQVEVIVIREPRRGPAERAQADGMVVRERVISQRHCDQIRVIGQVTHRMPVRRVRLGRYEVGRVPRHALELRRFDRGLEDTQTVSEAAVRKEARRSFNRLSV
jgi:hypothetical protein